MKKTKKQKNDYLALLLLLVIGYVTYGLNASYVRAMEINSSIKRQEALQHKISEMSVPELVDYIAPQYGQSTAMLKTIVCAESNFTVVPHDGGKATNVTGIWDSTFKGWLPKYEKQTGQTLNINSQFDQITLMSWAFSQGDEYRYQWSTYHAYVNGGKAKIWSRYYNKYITVVIPNHCK